MHLSNKEIWTALHGMVFGAGFLLLFSAGFLGIWNLRAEYLSAEGITRSVHRLAVGSCIMALLAWLAVLVGTYVIYPWYRAKAPVAMQTSSLMAYPKYFLLSNPRTADWHEFGMEWKEHIGWLPPIVLTAVAFIITAHGRRLSHDARLRKAVLFFYTVAFFSAAVAGTLGALINKAAPVR